MATPTEIALAALWETILETKNIDLDDDFFVLGGDSLSATRLVLSIQEIFDVDIPLEAVFRDANTITIRKRSNWIDDGSKHKDPL